MAEMTREDLLDVAEYLLRAQLKAVQKMRRPARIRPRKPTSNIVFVEELVREVGQPLHVNEILQLASARGRQLGRESVVSALTKKVLQDRTFFRCGPNRFGLLEWQAPPVPAETVPAEAEEDSHAE